MGIADAIVLVVILAIVGGATYYIYKTKKSGKACIGCPGSGCCTKNGGCSGACCGCEKQEK